LAFDTTNKTSTAFKNLLGKSQTDSSKELGNEAIPISFNVHANTIFIDTIDSTPANAVSAGIAVYVESNLILDATSNGHAYFAKWPVTPPSGTDPQTSNPFAYGLGSLENISSGDRITNIISYQYGDLYEAKPFDSLSNPISINDARDWIFQYQSGVFYQQDNVGNTPGSINLYVYIGNLLSTELSNKLWQKNGNDIQAIDFDGSPTIAPKILPSANDACDLGSTILRFKDLYLGSNIDYSSALLFKEAGTERARFQNNKFGINTTSMIAMFEVLGANTGSGTNDFTAKFHNSTGTNNSLVIRNDGNVGIGVSTPNNKIQVSGLINFNNTRFSTAIGYQALNVIAGNYNTAIGYQALLGNSSGNNNTAVGYNSGSKITASTSSRNVFIGSEAGGNTSTTYVEKNVLIGYYAGYSLTGNISTNGKNNVLIGHEAGKALTTGYRNTFIGTNTGDTNINGSYNVFIGHESGTGSIGGEGNICAGSLTGVSLITGSTNIFMGNSAGQYTTDGYNNVFLGQSAGNSNIVGHDNIVIGNQTSSINTVGNYNVSLGNEVDSNQFNYTVILGTEYTGGLTTADMDNQFVITDSITNYRLGGVQYIVPTTPPTTGQVLTTSSLVNKTFIVFDALNQTNAPYQVGETVTGSISGNTAVVVSEDITGTLDVSGSTGAFTIGENLTGSISGNISQVLSYTNNIGIGNLSWETFPKKYTTTFTPGTAGVPNTITHNLGTTAITIELWDATGKVIYSTINNRTTNSVDITFTVNPVGDVEIVVVG